MLNPVPVLAVRGEVDLAVPAKGEVMPQPHKGDRTYVPARVPTPYYRKLERLRMVTGQTKSDIIAEALAAHLDRINLEALEGQEPLPMSA